jgi:hypothetical protein
LRNRKTGQEVGAVAKQQLISLDAVDSIVGIQVTGKLHKPKPKPTIDHLN